jgi:hypothetical protein
MTKYRIKSINNEIFIAQKKSGFFGSWLSIDKFDFLYEWSYTLKKCMCTTFDEAENIIFKNKELHRKNNNIKYFYYDKI